MTAQDLETALFNILDRDVQQKRGEFHRCENEQTWGGGDSRDATPCNASGAKFYEWKEGRMDFEAYLCDSCAKDLGVL